MELRYISRNEADQYSFIRIPRELMTSEAFSGLSSPAKIMYGMLIDKMGTSLRNKWLDDEGHVYIVYPISELREDMKLSRRKTLDCLAELETIGLVEKKKRGGGFPNIIYVKKFFVQGIG